MSGRTSPGSPSSLFYPERDRPRLHRISAPRQPYPGEGRVLPSGKRPEESLLSLAGTARNPAIHEPFRPDRPERLRQHEGKHLQLVRDSRVHGELQPRCWPGEAKGAGGTFRRISSGSFPLPSAAMGGTDIGRDVPRLEPLHQTGAFCGRLLPGSATDVDRLEPPAQGEGLGVTMAVQLGGGSDTEKLERLALLARLKKVEGRHPAENQEGTAYEDRTSKAGGLIAIIEEPQSLRSESRVANLRLRPSGPMTTKSRRP